MSPLLMRSLAFLFGSALWIGSFSTAWSQEVREPVAGFFPHCGETTPYIYRVIGLLIDDVGGYKGREFEPFLESVQLCGQDDRYVYLKFINRRYGNEPFITRISYDDFDDCGAGLIHSLNNEAEFVQSPEASEARLIVDWLDARGTYHLNYRHLDFVKGCDSLLENKLTNRILMNDVYRPLLNLRISNFLVQLSLITEMESDVLLQVKVPYKYWVERVTMPRGEFIDMMRQVEDYFLASQNRNHNYSDSGKIEMAYRDT